jgi:hypothetical protein
VIGLGGGVIASGRIIDRLTRGPRRIFVIAPASLSVSFNLAFLWTPT